MKFDSKDLVASLVLLLLLFIFHSEVIFFQKYYALGVDDNIDFALRYFVAQAISGGHIPLWLPEAFGGSSVFARPSLGVFYPFNFFLMLPNTLGVFRNVILGHFFMAGWFMYLWIRRLGVRHLSALIGAIIFSYSGLLISWHENLSFLEAAIWLPLILLLFHYAFQRRDLRLALIGGFIIAVQFLAGSLLFSLGTVVYVTLWACFLWRKDPRQLQKALLLIAAGVGVAILSSLFLILPSLEYFLQTQSIDLFQFAPAVASRFWKVIGFIVPPWPHVLRATAGTYMGVCVFFLALCALLLKRHSPLETIINALLGMTALTLVALFTTMTVIRGWSSDLETAAFYLVFCLTTLAGLGFDRLLTVCEEWDDEEHRTLHDLFARILKGLSGGAAILWVGVLILFAKKESIIQALAVRGSPLGSADEFGRLLQAFLFVLALTSGAIVLLFKRLSYRGEERFFAALVLIVVTWELFQINDPLVQLKTRAEMVADLPPILRSSDIVTHPNTVDVLINGREPQVYRVNLPFAPGWRAVVNGKKVKAERVEDQLAVHLEAGKSAVRLEYRPFLYLFGKYFSFAFLVALAVYLLHPFTWKTLIRAFSLEGMTRD